MQEGAVVPDGAYTLIGIVAAALLAWYLSRRRDASTIYQTTADGDHSYAEIAKQAWDETARVREELARAQADREKLTLALERSIEGRKKDRAITTRRFTLITGLMEKCAESHPEYETDFAEFKAVQWTEGLNGGAG